MEYGGGIKALKVAVAEFEGRSPTLSLTRVPELCSIRNIMYDEHEIILRKSVSSSVKLVIEDRCENRQGNKSYRVTDNIL